MSQYVYGPTIKRLWMVVIQAKELGECERGRKIKPKS